MLSDVRPGPLARGIRSGASVVDIPSGAPSANIELWPGSSLGPKVYAVNLPADSRGPGVDPPPKPPRTGSGVPPMPGGGR